MEYSTLESKIETIIEPTLTSEGISLVRVSHDKNSGKNKILQIMVEHADGSPVTSSECGKISKSISALLDVEDPISDQYHLEVSSAGMERPLVKLEDYKKFSGRDAKISCFEPVNERHKFKGKIVSVVEEKIEIQPVDNEDNEPITIDYNNISSANLLITENLLREILNK